MPSPPLPSLRPAARAGQGCALDLCTAWLAVEAEHTNAQVMALFNERREITCRAVSEQERLRQRIATDATGPAPGTVSFGLSLKTPGTNFALAHGHPAWPLAGWPQPGGAGQLAAAAGPRQA